MNKNDITLNPNRLVRYLKKSADEFTKEDIIKFIIENNIEMLNFRYVADDGKLKSLNFVITSLEHLETVLSTGERVDGSSLFSNLEAGSSDLYVIPRYKTAFVNPFSEYPTLDILCAFYNSDGTNLESSSGYILKKAYAEFKKTTGYTFKVLGELEYYVISGKDMLYRAQDQKGYHESPPFTKWGGLRKEALSLISECGGKIKYAHSEVGNFSTETEAYEQHEIEFLPTDVEDAADQMVIAKWILRMLGEKYGAVISFAPKITVGKAGSGLHIHMLAEKDGKNVMADIENCRVSDVAKRIIAGLLDLAAPLSAFGNTIPTSFLRLVPHQEAPTNICWGDKNRSALVRVPLGWIAKTNMVIDANPQQIEKIPYIEGKQTVELRSPDGSANIHALIAGILVAAQHGLTMKNALEFADKLYIGVNIFKEEHKERLSQLNHLPTSCYEAAEALNEKRDFFEKNNIFPASTIDDTIAKLKSFNDINMSVDLYGKNDEIRRLVNEHLHCK